MRPAALIALLALPALLGCGTVSRKSPSAPLGQPKTPASKQALSEEAAIASALQLLAEKKAEYKISPSDLISISAYQEKDLAQTLRVTQSGTVSLPLIGTVKLGGLSLIEAETLLADKFKDYLVNPQITVFVKEYGNKKIYVLGEVARPGSYELPPESRLTVLEAVTSAGGFTPIAARDRTRVIRATPDGKSQSLTIEVSAITNRGEKQKDLPLEPNDVVYVPQSFF